MFKFFKKKPPEDSEGWYYYCYGVGAHARALGDPRKDNPYTYGTPHHDAWNDGWERRL